MIRVFYACCRYVSRLFVIFGKELSMETRVALIGIVVENLNSVERLNGLLHDYGQYIIGRMGIPYEKKGVSIISVAVDAPQDVISALSGKLGMIEGITAKTIYSKLGEAK
ncbi:MAG: iron-only hydrogenase system regulator [Muribaculaceae bacterium]|nr:iron-only hydrogenase system regulator [Muribaculaceae bacterium]MCM1480703.1 iron-only hydrogenase system regulator [Muribaculaceae bacterium]